MNRIFAFIIAALGFSLPLAVEAAQPPQIKTQFQPIFVRVPNGFSIPSRTNGASRRRKSNRLHLSTKTKNKHR